jgi:hypothetical protein
VAFDLGQPLTPLVTFQLLHLAVEPWPAGCWWSAAPSSAWRVRQFESIEVALGHLVLLAGVIFVWQEINAER